VQWNTETVILRGFLFFAVPGWDFRNAGTFSQDYFTHKATYICLSLFKGCWNMQENLDSEIFWAGDGRFCGNFPPFCILESRDQTSQLFYCTKELFMRRIFSANKNSVMKPSYTIATPYHTHTSIDSKVKSSGVKSSGVKSSGPSSKAPRTSNNYARCCADTPRLTRCTSQNPGSSHFSICTCTTTSISPKCRWCCSKATHLARRSTRTNSIILQGTVHSSLWSTIDICHCRQTCI